MSDFDRCFACNKKLAGDAHWEAIVLGEVTRVFVGQACYELIAEAGPGGYQPVRGGPRLIAGRGVGLVHWCAACRKIRRFYENEDRSATTCGHCNRREDTSPDEAARLESLSSWSDQFKKYQRARAVSGMWTRGKK